MEVPFLRTMFRYFETAPVVSDSSAINTSETLLMRFISKKVETQPKNSIFKKGKIEYS